MPLSTKSVGDNNLKDLPCSVMTNCVTGNSDYAMPMTEKGLYRLPFPLMLCIFLCSELLGYFEKAEYLIPIHI
jgi:hypothetical protein